MSLHGTCKTCGHETIDYVCGVCASRKIEQLEIQLAEATKLVRADEIQRRTGWSVYKTDKGWGVCDGLVAGVTRSPLLSAGAGKAFSHEADLERLLFHAEPADAIIAAEAWLACQPPLLQPTA